MHNETSAIGGFIFHILQIKNGGTILQLAFLNAWTGTVKITVVFKF